MSAPNLAARIVALREAVEADDAVLALDVVRDLERDLVPVVPTGGCPECGLRMWPGQLPRHLSVVHGVDALRRAA